MANQQNPINQQLVIFCGADLAYELPVIYASDGTTPVDVSSGMTATLIIRETNFDGAVVDTFTESTGLDLTTSGASGIIILNATAAETLAMRGNLTKGVYTLEVTTTATSSVRRTHEGEAILKDTTIQS